MNASKNNISYTKDSQIAIDMTAPRAARLTLLLVLAVVITGLVWANYAMIDLATISEGKVVPSSNLQVVQNLEGGIVKKISVNEGDIVRKDQVLLRLNDTRFKAEYKKELARYATLETEMIRLHAEAQGKDTLVFPDNIKKFYPKLVQHTTEHFNNNRKALQNSVNVLKHSIALTQKELSIVTPLTAKGVMSTVEKLRLERQLNELKSRITDKIEHARNSARAERNKIKSEHAVLSEQITSTHDRMLRTVIRSPVDGVVNKIYITTIGEVINPGMKILEVVPIDDRLTVEIRVKPADIGFIRLDQKAVVKISAYDFSVYGDLDARVVNIGADAVTDKDGNNFYEVKLQTAKNFLEAEGKKLRIMPGMTVTANILTGKRSVLNYLLKPIIGLKSAAQTPN